MAEYTEQRLLQLKDWKIITPAQLGIINFVYAPKNTHQKEIDNYSKLISEKVIEDGFALITTTQINDLTVLRMCPIHPGLTKKDIRQTIEKLQEFASAIKS